MKTTFLEETELVNRINKFYLNIERLLATRTTPKQMNSAEKINGARSAYESWLRVLAADELQKIFPDEDLAWDDQLTITSEKQNSGNVMVDLIDGAKEYFRDGAAVTSHIGLYNNSNKFEMGLVSYPFHNFRVLALKDQGVFYLPFTERNFEANKLQYDSIDKHKNRKDVNVFDLSILDRYGSFDMQDPTRFKLDAFRFQMHSFGGKYAIPRGSVAKNIIDVALGRKADVAICKHDPVAKQKVPAHDYLTPGNILQMVGGVFTDLEGNVPNGIDPIDGFIAAKNQASYEAFTTYLK